MKKKAAMLAIGVLMAFGFAFHTAITRAGQKSSNPCRNKCEQAYRSCVASAKNPGGLNQCKRAFDSCLTTCR